MKAILMSIQSQHLFNILTGNKTLELRKSVPKDFKGWVYVYCTKAKPYLLYEEDWIGGNYVPHRWTFLHNYPKKEAYEIWGSAYENEETYVGIINGLVVARFWYDESEKVDFSNLKRFRVIKAQAYINNIQFIFDYAKGKDIYAWHIKKLEIFDKPMELSGFYKNINSVIEYPICSKLYVTREKIKECEKQFQVAKAPQSWQYVYVKENL